MTPEECVLATKAAVKHVGGAFMLDAHTYQRGAELGFPGLSFYIAGRCGVLGRTPANVVRAAMFWFEPDAVETFWTQGLEVMEPGRAAEHFASCGHDWARSHLSQDPDLEVAADLVARVNAAADPAGLSLFAAWQVTPRPGDAQARLLHEIHVLRELRGAAHGIAVACAGVRPLDAVLVSGGEPNAQLFGWKPPFDEPSAYARQVWETAERVTDEVVAVAYSALDAGELDS
ncbi:MAG: hypothetical protein IT198_15935, partial [Acidimicrobiia bacterium]|nr:hypothetical protein [Acidimicrobiia bacterium]